VDDISKKKRKRLQVLKCHSTTIAVGVKIMEKSHLKICEFVKYDLLVLSKLD